MALLGAAFFYPYFVLVSSVPEFWYTITKTITKVMRETITRTKTKSSSNLIPKCITKIISELFFGILVFPFVFFLFL